MSTRLPVSLSRIAIGAALGLFGLAGCQAYLDSRYADSVAPAHGVQPLKGLAGSVSVRRNALGMPLIEVSHCTMRSLPWATCMPATGSGR